VKKRAHSAKSTGKSVHIVYSVYSVISHLQPKYSRSRKGNSDRFGHEGFVSAGLPVTMTSQTRLGSKRTACSHCAARQSEFTSALVTRESDPLDLDWGSNRQQLMKVSGRETTGSHGLGSDGQAPFPSLIAGCGLCLHAKTNSTSTINIPMMVWLKLIPSTLDASSRRKSSEQRPTA
jgi:hypothetical protein